MKPFRLLLIGVGTLVVLLLLAGAMAFNSSVQTWAARKALASRPEIRAAVGSVAAGMKRLELRDLRFEQDGAVLTVPAVEVELPLLSAGLGKKVFVSRLVAKGWTLDLSKATNASSAGPIVRSPGFSRNPTEPAKGGTTNPNPAVAVPQAFAGVFAQLQLPVDVSLDGVDLEGEVVLPEARGRTKVTLKGGGLGAGREGRFDLTATAALVDPGVNAVEIRGGLVAAMDTPRRFTRLSAKLVAAASGAKFPKGVKLTSDLAAARSERGETYAVAVVADGQEILNVKADFPRDAKRLDGTWKVDVRDVDVAPFALGMPLPAVTAVGGGRFDTDASFSALHATGRLNASVDRLQVLKPELAALGELKIAADFDLAEHGGTISVRKFEATISAAEPIAIARSLQAFEFNPGTGELQATDASRELFGVALSGVPVAWLKPLLKEVELSGGKVRGEFVATPRGGGLSLRSVTPLMIDGISVAQSGKPLVRQVDLSLNVAADYTPQGWQAEISALTAKSGDATLITLEAKAGQLTGRERSLKATGRLTADLPAVLAQPLAQRGILLTNGGASIDFVASVSAKNEIQARVALQNLVTVVETKAVKLPAVSADIRADFAPDGKIVFSVPLLIERNDRKSDLSITGNIAPEKDKVRAVEGNVTSSQLVVEDTQLFAAIMPAEKTAPSESPRDAGPPWAGLNGTVALQLQKVVYGETFEATNVRGRLRIDAGMLKLEGMQAGLGESGRANLNGTVTYNASASQAYSLVADVAVKEFDPGPLFRAMNGNRPATIEGKFDISSKVAARASALGDLALGAGGDFQLTSKGGVFRGLPVSVGNLTETTGKVAGWIASAGTALSAITGKKETADIANNPQAIRELTKGLNLIPYHQLSVVVARDAALNATLKDFTLIAPELRLTGSGTVLHRTGASLIDDPLAMEFKLRARGRQAELLKYLGALETQPDDLGYAACTLPLRVGGTLANPDTSELNGKLVALALEKSGVTDKAADLFNKLLGGGK